MRRVLRAAPIVTLLFVVVGLLEARELKDDRTFFLPFGNTSANEMWMAKEVELPGIYSVDPQSEIGRLDYVATNEEGKPLSPSVVRTFEDLRSGGLSVNWGVMPLGKTDQAVVFDAKGRVPASSGSITFWFRGKAWDYTETADKNKDIPRRVNLRTWDTNTPLRETFFELRGPGGAVSFGKLERGKFSLEGTDGKRISFPIDFDVSLVHMVCINYANAKAQIFIDGEVKGEGALVMPAEIKEIAAGHVGEGGEKWNRWLDDFAIWKRPLTTQETMLLWRKEGMIQLPLETTIPKISTPPTIDGILKEGEWDKAAVVTGMNSISIWGGYSVYTLGGDLSDLKDRVFIAYDDKNLYVGYHCPPPREIIGNTAIIASMLKRSISAFDANVDSDDAFHICLQYPRPGGDLYNIFVNGLNTHYDFHFTGHDEGSRLPGSPGFIKLAWDPKWISASTLDTDGWHLEEAIPLDSFDIPAPGPGDVWYINFMRCWQSVRSGIQSWAWGNRTMNEDGNERSGAPAGRVVFGGPGVIVRQRSIGEISQGKPHFISELINTDTKDRSVYCIVETNSKELSDEKQITVPAGGTAVYEFTGRIADSRTAVISMKVLDENRAPIMLAGYFVQRPSEADIYFRNYPTHDLVKYEVDFSNHARYEPETISALVIAKNEKGTKVWQKPLKDFKDYNFTVEIPTGELPQGKYNVEFVFKAGSKKLETATQTFEKKPFPEWYGNKLGYDKGWAPCPWVNVEAKDNAINVWGRTYDFAETLYPKTVTTQGKSVLRAPMGIVLETSEGKLSADARVTDARWTLRTEGRVEGVRRVSLGKLTLENNFWVEYDGLVWSTLKLIPEGKVTIKNLAFEIPFNRDSSDVINTMDYSMRNTGKFKPEGYVGAGGPVWLGSAYGGIQWDAETAGPYEVTEPNSCLKVTNTPEGGTIRIEFINKDTVLSKPREIPFGFIATPVRPRVLRTVNGSLFQRYANFLGFFPETEPWVPFTFSVINKGSAQRGREWSSTLPGVEARIAQYATLFVMADTDDAMLQFGDEWLQDASTRWRGKYRLAPRYANVTTAAKSLRDYLAWRFNEFFKEQPIAGGYFDVSSVSSSSNPYAGAGYLRDDGTRAPSLNLLGHREVIKRIYNIQNTVFPGGGNWWHASEGPRMIYMSYCVGDYDGENGNSIINADNPTYRTMLTPDNYRAQYMGSNWGFWNNFLSQGRITAKALREYGFSDMWDQWTGLQWLHDCYCGTGWFSQVGHLEGLLSQRDVIPFNKYHMFSPFNRFIGYWEQTITQVESPEFYASFYIKDPVKQDGHFGPATYNFYSNYDTGLDDVHQAVLIFYNHGVYEGPVRLKIDWKQLGFDGWENVKAINAVHSTGFRVINWDVPIPQLSGELYDNSEAEYARIENGELVFPITEYNYRMIVMQAPKPWQGLQKIEGKK